MKRFKKNKGIALILTLIALSMLAVIGFGLITITTSEARTSVNQMNSTKAYYLARLGLSRGIAELKYDAWWGTDGAFTYETDEGSYTVSVWASPNNVTTSDLLWKVISTGHYGESDRTLTAWVTKESFASFAYFTNLDGSQNIMFANADKLSGRVHTNDYFIVRGQPQFSDRMTSANRYPNTSGGWEVDPYYNAANRSYKVTSTGTYSSDRSKFYRCYQQSSNFAYTTNRPTALNGSGRFAFRGGQPFIPMPEDTRDIEGEANIKYDCDVSLYFNEDGTVEITKPVASTRFNYNISNSSGFSWNWRHRNSWAGDGEDPLPEEYETEIINIDETTIHVNGHVSIDGGTLKGKFTIGGTNNIYIRDSVIYSDRNSDVLGIVADNDILVDTNPYAYKNLEIDASIMAINGKFTVHNYNIGTQRGILTIFGGLIQQRRGAVATTGGTGYNKDYVFDKKLVNIPPKSFPCTGNLKIIAMFDHSAIGGEASE